MIPLMFMIEKRFPCYAIVMRWLFVLFLFISWVIHQSLQPLEPTTPIPPVLQSFIPAFGPQPQGCDLPRNAWVQFNHPRTGVGWFAACVAQICVNMARWRLQTTSCMNAPNLNLRATSINQTLGDYRTDVIDYDYLPPARLRLNCK